MFGTSRELVGLHNIEISDSKKKFQFETEVTRVELLLIDNPRYDEIIANYSHFEGINIQNNDEKECLPVHLVLRTKDHSKIRTATKPKVRHPGKPVAKLTKFGWMIMSSGEEVN